MLPIGVAEAGGGGQGARQGWGARGGAERAGGAAVEAGCMGAVPEEVRVVLEGQNPAPRRFMSQNP